MHLWRIVYTPYQEIQFTGRHISTPHQNIQYIRHNRKCYAYVKSNIYATSGDTRNKSHPEIQAVRHTREYHLCLKNNIYSIWGDTMQCTPHQEKQQIAHTKNKRMFAIPGNIVYVWRTIDPSYQETQCIVRHTRKYKKYARQVIQGVRNTRNCYVALTNSIYATSGYTVYMP